MANEFKVYKSRADLEKLLNDGLVETTTVEFKASEALSRDNKKMDELCISVSAMANSAGGQIFYCIDEQKKTSGPVRIDNGVTDSKVTREWIEQVLISRIQPRMNDYRIDEIDLDAGGRGFLISVPQSQIGPHQAPDKKYYRRFELQARAMEDYEIKDVLRRATTPDLFVSLSFLAGSKHQMEFAPHTEQSRPFNLIARIENRSPQPAHHVIVDIGMDVDLIIKSRGAYTQLPGTTIESRNRPFNWVRWSLASPPGLPIFREHVTTLTDNVLMLALHSQYLRGSNLLDLSVKVSAPGFSSIEHWAIVTNGNNLEIHPPGSHWARQKEAV